jgi:hypothetical protein
MHKLKLKTHNKTKITLLIGGIFLLFFIAILVPLWFVNYLALSGVGHFFNENIIYGLITVVILLYFMISGGYYYNIIIDTYIIKFTSYRPIMHFLKEKDFIDIPHKMLADYAFSKKLFSLNKTLIFKIKTNSGKKITKRFNITLISEMEIDRISSALDIIIAKNN